ncbi:GH92 family glycosyl hydrolase [Cellulosimicrobium arenosum]|uniref:GH92 family glycosyl hydrolase n=1 Tax=Cellulosimicrobium arenosum TaxID=2708133 RepID=A0A927J1Y8_9MICO|nr:GH92 family glycosyl hydrolase [Cellulosimicrobium arenosum]MBD8080426.1 GH92 family glycosyl hydrolase [Cellulosimicrobium arenosum]
MNPIPPRRRGARRIVATASAAALLAAGLGAAPALAASPAPIAAPAAADDAALVSDPLAYVDPMVGTGQATGVVGEINNFPGPSMPFGMMQLSPDTQVSVDNGDKAYAGYRYSHSAIRGFSMTHAAAGCWIFGDVPILPVTGDVGTYPWDRKETFSHDSENAEVGRYSVTLQDSGIEAELSAATRSGGLSFEYPDDGKDAQIIINAAGSLASVKNATIDVEDARTITGSVTTGGFCGKNNTQTTYFAIELDQDSESYGTWEGSTVSPGDASSDGDGAGAWLTFAPGSTVQAKVGMSYVSVDGARANLAAEIPGFDFDAVRDATRAAWSDLLGKVRVAGEDEDATTMLYTSLYHSLLHPNTFNDVDGRYIGFDGEIHEVEPGHTQYANFSDWDTYRSLGALQSVLEPERASDMAQSLVNDADQSGWLPRWPVANQHVGQMTGDSSVPLIASMYAFGAHDFDVESALEHMVKGATSAAPTDNGYVQRRGIETYLERGYAPQTEEFRGDHQVVGASITLEWSIADFAIGQVASALGHDDVATQFAQRGQWWQHVLDPVTRTSAARNPDGTFVRADGGAGFGQAGFDEGNSEQYTWLVPQNVAGLVEGLGGRDAVTQRLDAFTSKHNVGANEPYLWIGNEPDFGVPWLYDYVGQPWRTSELVDELTSTLFRPEPDGKPGNDDLGAQAGWYVWASLGLYPTTPGTDVLALNAPRFDRVVIDLGEGKTLDLRADGASTGARYISGVTVDGERWDSTALPRDLVHDGGVVELGMSTERDTTWGADEAAAPPSWRDGEDAVTAAADPSLVSVVPGESVDATVVAQLFGSAQLGDVSVSVDAPDGIEVGTPDLVDDGTGKLSGSVPVVVSDDVPDGYHDVTLVVSAGGQGVDVPLTVLVAPEGSFVAALDTVGSAPEANRGVGNFDGAGNSFSREALGEAGLTPGSQHEVDGLTYTWPASGVGRPDSLTTSGETVRLGAATTGLSFVGAATNGTQRGDVVVTLDDGSTVTTELAFGDWVLPSADGSPVAGNSVVAQMNRRNGDMDSAFVFATEPWTAPEGRRAVSVTFPNQGELHVFAIATDPDAVDPEPQVEVTAQARCLAGGAYVAVRVTNTGDEPLSIDLSTAFGSKTFAEVAPGRNAYQSFAVRAGEVAAGEVTVSVTADGGEPQVLTAVHDAITCS